MKLNKARVEGVFFVENESLIIVEVTEEAARYISEKGARVVTVMLAKSGGCWSGGSVTVPVLELKAPKMPEHYQVEQIQGLTVYVPKRLPTKEGKITIVVDKILFMRRLDILGVKVR